MRRRLGLPQYKLAAMAGVPAPRVSRLCSLQEMGYPKALAAIATVLSVEDPSTLQDLVDARTGAVATVEVRA